MIRDPREQQAAVIEHLLSEPEAGHEPEGIDDGQKEQPTREDRRYAPDPQKYGNGSGLLYHGHLLPYPIFSRGQVVVKSGLAG
jgi:hypothetical protein